MNQRGLLLPDILVAAFGITLCASLCFRSFGEAASTLALSDASLRNYAAAADVIARDASFSRSLLNPDGTTSPEEAGGRELPLSNRTIMKIAAKEVIPGCPGLKRWVVEASSLPEADPRKTTAVRLPAVSFDPF